jgi:hypothetical protein
VNLPNESIANRIQRALRESKNENDMYLNLTESIKFVVSMGYDYESVLNWNVGGFFHIMSAITKFAKIKYGAKK